jgi:hypothetical protein
MTTMTFPHVEVQSLHELEQLEQKIAGLVRREPLDGLLLALRGIFAGRQNDSQLPQPFMVAAATRFAVRYGEAGAAGQNAGGPISMNKLAPIIRLATAHALADPVWDDRVPKGELPIFMRHVGNQFPFNVSGEGKWGRSQILFNEVPNEIKGRRGVPAFDFSAKFQEICGVTVTDFIDVCYVAYSAAESTNHLGFARDYFEKARDGGMRIGGDEVVAAVLRRIAADPKTHREVSDRYRQADRTYGAYDFNSLMVHPLIRPWLNSRHGDMASDRMLAPIPRLLLYRLSTGIYYQMHERFKGDFDQYFGHVLEAYVGRLLRSFVGASNLYAEADIRQSYPTKCGKVPDWIIIDGRAAILIECKCSRMHRIVYVKGSEDDLRKSLRDVVKGLTQLHEFQTAVLRRVKGLERFAGVDQFVPVVVTLEPLYLASSVPFKKLLRAELTEQMQAMDWSLLSLDDLETYQFYLAAGVDVAATFKRTMTEQYNRIIESLHQQTGKVLGDSLLCEKEQELTDRIGVPLTFNTQ